MRLACILILFASLASAQTTEPKLSDAAHAKLRDIQLQQKTLEAQYMQIQQQITAMQAQFNSLSDQLKSETDAAYKEAGVTREEWTLDLVTLKFAKAEKKLEEKKP